MDVRYYLLTARYHFFLSLVFKLVADLVPVRLQQLYLMGVLLVLIFQFELFVPKLLLQPLHQCQKVLLNERLLLANLDHQFLGLKLYVKPLFAV